jgi:hypothetical protein
MRRRQLPAMPSVVPRHRGIMQRRVMRGSPSQSQLKHASQRPAEKGQGVAARTALATADRWRRMQRG